MTDSYKTTCRNIVPAAAESAIKHTGGEKGESSEVGRNEKGKDTSSADSDPKLSAKVESQEKPSSSDTRPKQGVPSTYSFLVLDQKLIV